MPTTATTAHAEALAHARRQLDTVTAVLAEADATTNPHWGHVGDVERVNEVLADLLAGFGHAVL